MKPHLLSSRRAFSCFRLVEFRGKLRVWLVATAVLGKLVSASLSAAPATPVSTESLLDDMTGIAGMAEFPSPGYTAKQFSSYDRKSKSPSEEWFANGDAGQFLRTETRGQRTEYVLMDAAGPGAITRIWSANPEGTLRIYIDESVTPALEAPMSELLGGKFPGLPRPIAGEYSKGWNLYFPIAYTKHCKVTSDRGGFYYHVNYRTYEAGTTVRSFTMSQLNSLKPKISTLETQLANPRGNEENLGGESQDFQMEVGPGESVQESFEGSKAFTRALVKVASPKLEMALRSIIVRITFDGERCIDAPLGDLFGSAPGLNAFSTLPLGMTKDGEMYWHWFMPFRRSAVIELHNFGSESATLSGSIALRDYDWTERSMHFHAKWRTEFDVPTRPMRDWNYLTAKGQGVFAGVSFSIDNPVKQWWGEGDEKIYVDGEKFPSHFGTGTEDYFGYAWCWPATFTHAYHSQPRCDGPGNYGRTSVNRFHILDRIPFKSDFKFDMELWHWNETCRVNMAVVAYWYARPGATDAFPAIEAQDTRLRPIADYVVPKVSGALEGEELKITQVKGNAEPQDWDDTSNGRHLWWHAGMNPGDSLVLSFPAPKTGRYEVFGRFLTARDYGIHQLSINGTPAGSPRDFYSPDVKPTDEISLGTFDLREGLNSLNITVVGANEKAQKAYMFGLDYLRLRAK